LILLHSLADDDDDDDDDNNYVQLNSYLHANLVVQRPVMK
jgi:hypothetical protein